MNINLAPANGIVRTKVLANPARAKTGCGKTLLAVFFASGGIDFRRFGLLGRGFPGFISRLEAVLRLPGALRP